MRKIRKWNDPCGIDGYFSDAGTAAADPFVEKLSEVKASKDDSVSITFDADGTVSKLVYKGKEFYCNIRWVCMDYN